jgi:HEAT repeat protein
VSRAGAVARAADLAALGLRGALTGDDVARLTVATADDDARVRSVAVGALVRAATLEQAATAWSTAADDRDSAVRRRVCELGPALVARGASVEVATGVLLTGTADRDVTVVEAAAWALGELGDDATDDVVTKLVDVAGTHRDALAREAAVAALGAIGREAGLPAILAACADKPAVRRRAVLALAPFDGPAVDAAIEAALTDRDWQVRQAAEDLRDA